MRYFFLSYARGDDDEYVRKFFLDLSREIRVIEGLPRNEHVGFMDTDSLQVGREWIRGLDTALAECPVFIPLYTPGYFRSQWCGREWTVFQHRLPQGPDPAGGSGTFVPVVWLLPPTIPEAAQGLHYATGAFGAAYARFGLRQLIRLRRHEDDYEETVSALAREIVASSRRHRSAPVAQQSLGDVPSAFHTDARPDPAHHDVPDATGDAPQRPPPDSRPRPTSTPTTATEVSAEGEPPPAQAGPRRVHFVVAGASRNEMRSVRASLDCYGPTPQHWAPYRPELPDPLGSFACEIAAGQELKSEIADLDELPDRMDRADQRNQIVVLLVDPWIARLSGYGEALLEYDRRNAPTVPVLVALSDHDEETRSFREDLALAVCRSFPNNSLRRDAIFRPDVRTASQFAVDLEKALQIAVNRLMKRGTVTRTPPGPPVPRRAVLQSPDSLRNRRAP